MSKNFEGKLIKFSEKLEKNKWVKRFGFWMDNSIAPVGKVLVGYVLGIAFVVLFLPNVSIHILGTESLLSTTMASFLVVFTFGFVGYGIMTFAFDMGGAYDAKNKKFGNPPQLGTDPARTFRENCEAGPHLLHDKFEEEI